MPASATHLSKIHRITTAPSSSPAPPPDHFRLSFGISSSTFEWLSSLLDPLLDCRDPSSPLPRLPPPTRLAPRPFSPLLRLPPTPTSPTASRVPESTARFSARRLYRVLCTNFRFWLAFPSLPDLNLVCSGFQSLPLGLPDCCGSIISARFLVHSGASVAAQIVTDSSSRILSIAAGFNGEKSDYQVLQCSSLYKDVVAGRLLSSTQYFVGDGNYPLLPWLMVPYKDPIRGTCEEDFNVAHGLMFQPALRTVASLRNWGALGCLGEEEDLKMAVACIGTCAILHNVLLMREDYTAPSDESRGFSEVPEQQGEDLSCDSEKKALVLRSMLSIKARMLCSSSNLVSK
ncbi:protein ALP1-like [Dioscorea cayenensis subsp. rotundata]|uniref:Protein ALP1-like n=1 Tax=Dioscorea cayennensis subsp. rotundata TaxID=55577 RepID=A0AB40C3U5_DIOCR|nr:protein ALP1-like [Dioscorea cayenensis subsp. rotundata]